MQWPDLTRISWRRYVAAAGTLAAVAGITVLWLLFPIMRDLILRCVRAAGALAGAAAGIAALLTEGAFTKREQPLKGRWEDTPFAQYRLMPWGRFLLSVILTAAFVQIIGDWLKDMHDDQKLKDTSAEISSQITSAVDITRAKILKTVQIASQTQADAAAKASDQLRNVAADARRILTQSERILQPLGIPRISIIFDVNCAVDRYSICKPTYKYAEQHHWRFAHLPVGREVPLSALPSVWSTSVYLSIFRDKLKLRDHLTATANTIPPAADLGITLNIGNYSPNDNPPKLYFYTGTKQISIMCMDMTAIPELLSKNGFSFPDLKGATLILGVDTRDPSWPSELIPSELIPTWLELTTATGQSTTVRSFTPEQAWNSFMAMFP
jgi:hypothetical protein